MPDRRLFLSLLAAAALAPAGLVRAGLVRAAGHSLLDTLGTERDLAMLNRAVSAAGLREVFADKGPFTVFAPSDAAFAAQPEGWMDRMLSPDEAGELGALLRYHLVARRLSVKALDQQILPVQTVQGGYLQINGMAGVRVNDARVTRPDIEASNGVIHVIDRVLRLPA
jgi:uncharacterized surface protein with fasciclin (FAS1) repeats